MNCSTAWRMRALGRGVGPCLLLVSLLTACGGGGQEGEPSAASADARQQVQAATTGDALMSQADAVRLAQQATFGPTEALVTQMRSLGAATWLDQQFALSKSRYTSGEGDRIHTLVSQVSFCDTTAQKTNKYCWRDHYSADPLVWDFYRNAVNQPDQLRQRVALALSHLLVISEKEVNGTYGLRAYQNMLLNLSFGNYRQVLTKVTLSPLMGDYLDHVNNDRVAPNENYARELLQLFALGTCQLLPDGSLKGGRCQPVYDNAMVRNYAFALTGWTYPAGGKSYWGCWPKGANCRYYTGDMVPAPALRDPLARSLLRKVEVPAGATAPQATELVMDSLMRHPNLAPFVSKRLIQHLVSSDPEPAYVARVAAAFEAGRFSVTDARGTHSYGQGRRGDLTATVAAILLDASARNASPDAARAGHLRAPVLLFTGALRAFNGHTDGAPFVWWWGETLRQHLFRSPSVFGFYPPDFPVPGTQRVGPEFAIHGTNGALDRLNVLSWLFDWGGSAPDASVPGAVGTGIDPSAFVSEAVSAASLVDRISALLLGEPLAEPSRQQVIAAVSYWTSSTGGSTWRERRVSTAAYLVLASPSYQVQR